MAIREKLFSLTRTAVVSIIVPIYNAGYKLHMCIQSVMRQSFPNWTLILIDDGSTDDSAQIAACYVKQDSRIALYKQLQLGSVEARRSGIHRASTPYLMFVDADDWLHDKAVDRLLDAALKDEADITVCNSYRVWHPDAWLRRLNRSHYFQQEKLYNKQEIKSELVPAFLHGHPFPASLHGKLYKSELPTHCGSYLSQISFFGDDLYFNLEMFLKANRVVILTEPLYYYRAGGATNHYMPSLFQDMVNGYKIQKEIIDHYYECSRDYHYMGIHIMLLSTLRTCLINLFLSELTDEEKKQEISTYCSDAEIVEGALQLSVSHYFSNKFLRAIHEGDVAYLYRLGRRLFLYHLPRRKLLQLLQSL